MTLLLCIGLFFSANSRAYLIERRGRKQQKKNPSIYYSCSRSMMNVMRAILVREFGILQIIIDMNDIFFVHR